MENNKILNQNWVEKYKPQHIKDIIKNKYRIKDIIEWLDNYEINKKIYLENPKKRRKIKIPDIVSEGENNNRKTDGDLNSTIIAETIDYTDFDDNEKIQDDIDKEFQNKHNKNKSLGEHHSCMIVLGDHGVGKTCTVMSILNDKGYNIQIINLNTIGTIKKIDDYVEKLLKGIHILNHLIDNTSLKVAIVIDEIESITSQIEKKFICDLLKLNEKNWYKPIIFISNNKHNKIISALKMNSKNIYFDQPTKDHLMELLVRICCKEKIKLEDEKVADKIINHSQKDFRRLLFSLQDVKNNYNENISNDIIDEYCKISKKKDIDIDIYKATSMLLIKYNNIDECIKLYESEKVIIPLMIHQNYIKCLTTFYKNKAQSFKIANDIAKSIAIGDNIENYIYNEQIWDMKDAHCYFTCIFPSFKLTNEKMFVTEEKVRNILEFPYDLNRTSIKKINKKNVINSNMCLKNFEIKDFLCANKLIKKLLEDGKIEECANLFNGYSATVENIESILKIDKINETKINLPSQIKKKLKMFLTK
jgi:hypothetical protein